MWDRLQAGIEALPERRYGTIQPGRDTGKKQATGRKQEGMTGGNNRRNSLKRRG